VATDLIVVQDESEAERMGLRPGTWLTEGDLASLAVFSEEERRKIFRTMLITGGKIAGVADLRRKNEGSQTRA
jgi:dihydroorotase-like cyclic amidohydrolase